MSPSLFFLIYTTFCEGNQAIFDLSGWISKPTMTIDELGVDLFSSSWGQSPSAPSWLHARRHRISLATRHTLSALASTLPAFHRLNSWFRRLCSQLLAASQNTHRTSPCFVYLRGQTKIRSVQIKSNQTSLMGWWDDGIKCSPSYSSLDSSLSFYYNSLLSYSLHFSLHSRTAAHCGVGVITVLWCIHHDCISQLNTRAAWLFDPASPGRKHLLDHFQCIHYYRLIEREREYSENPAIISTTSPSHRSDTKLSLPAYLVHFSFQSLKFHIPYGIQYFSHICFLNHLLCSRFICTHKIAFAEHGDKSYLIITEKHTKQASFPVR